MNVSAVSPLFFSGLDKGLIWSFHWCQDKSGGFLIVIKSCEETTMIIYFSVLPIGLDCCPKFIIHVNEPDKCTRYCRLCFSLHDPWELQLSHSTQTDKKIGKVANFECLTHCLFWYFQSQSHWQEKLERKNIFPYFQYILFIPQFPKICVRNVYHLRSKLEKLTERLQDT